MLLARAPAPVLERPTSGNPSGQPPALAQFLESLAMVEALEIDQVYPGHGEPFADYRTVIRRQRERIEQRLEECLGLITAGHRTVAALMVKMYTNQLHLIGLWMLVGYLHLLEAEARVEVQVKDSEWHYFQK